MPTTWHMVRVRVPSHLEEEAAARLGVPGWRGAWTHGEDDGSVCLEAAYETEAGAEAGAREARGLLESAGLPASAVERSTAPDEPWVERVEASRRPLALPGGWRVLPRAEGATGPRDLVVPPTRAFGSGEHPTTRLTCDGLLRCLRPGDAVLDLGTGSALLALVAARAGAGRVLGVDLDPDAALVARGNARRNGLGGRVHLAAGSAAAVRGPFDVVLANIERETLRELAGDIAAVQRPGGRAVLSGLLRRDAAPVAEVFAEVGYERTGQRTEGDWAALDLRRGREA